MTPSPRRAPETDAQRYTLAELQACPDLCIGQADTLKIESELERVWLSRCTVADGEPFDNAVTVERRTRVHGGRTDWFLAERYPAE